MPTIDVAAGEFRIKHATAPSRKDRLALAAAMRRVAWSWDYFKGYWHAPATPENLRALAHHTPLYHLEPYARAGSRNRPTRLCNHTEAMRAWSHEHPGWWVTDEWLSNLYPHEQKRLRKELTHQ